MAEEQVSLTNTEETTDKQNTVAAPEKKPKKVRTLNDILKCALVLVLIAAVAGVLLGAINYVTYVDPENTIKEKVGSLYDVSADSISNVTSEYTALELDKSKVNAVYEVNDNVTAFYVKASGAYKGTVEFVVCVKDGKVDEIFVYSDSETVSIGGKVLKQKNLDQYKGVLLSSVDTTSLAGSDEAKASNVYISGATKTTKAVVNAIRVTAKAYASRGGETA
ncbi:MAG: FMN-binding protein [Clostridia bacterium]|nr:FMN-binding protein [Clostridia bacterium]